MAPRLIAIVHLPPPHHGVSVVSAAAVDWLSRRFSVRVVNMAYGGLKPSPANLPRYVGTILRAALTLLLAGRRGDAVYMSLSAGPRAWVDLGLVLCCRARGLRLIVHHHSRAYGARSQRAMRLIYGLLGPGDVSIFLGSAHQGEFDARYRNRTVSLAISNAALIPPDRAPARSAPKGEATVGYLSNIELTKGIDLFVEGLRAARARGQAVRGLVAGPYRDAASRDIVEAAEADGLLRYLGPVYGEQKGAFYRSIDLFLFPSRYAHETEPLVVLDAMAQGAPVIATAVGSLPEILGPAYLLPAYLFSGDADRICQTIADRIAEVVAHYGQASSDMTDRLEQARGRGLEALDRLAAAIDPR